MKLLTKKIIKQIPKFGDQENKGDDAIVYVEFFLPGTRWTWYATEFDGEDTFFGWVQSGISSDFDELGYFSLNELKSIRSPLGLPVERNMHLKPTRIGDFK